MYHLCLFLCLIFFIFDASSDTTIERCQRLQITYAAKFIDPITYEHQLLQEYNTTLEFEEGVNSTTLFTFSNIKSNSTNSTYNFQMKIKIFIGYGDSFDYGNGYVDYYSVYDCKAGSNNSCTSSVPYASYYGFVPTFSDGSYCEISLLNPLFYKGHAFQSRSSQEFGQIIGKDYSEILLDMDDSLRIFCNGTSEESSNINHYLQQYCIYSQNYTLPAQSSTCSRFNASFEILDGEAQIAASNLLIDVDDSLSTLNVTINGTISNNSLFNCTALNSCDFYLDNLQGDTLESVQRNLHFLFLQPRNLILLDFNLYVNYPNGSTLYVNSLSSTILKYVDRIFYKDDNNTFSNEDPCSKNTVSGFLLVGNTDEGYEVVGSNLITKSQICCTNWKELNQLGPITTTPTPIAPGVNQQSQCSAFSFYFSTNASGHTQNVSAVIQFKPENSTTLFYITNITIFNPILGYDLQLYFLNDIPLYNYHTIVTFNHDPITQKISNETEIEISVPGISTIGIGDNGVYKNYIDVTFGLFGFYEGNVLDTTSNGLYFDAFNGEKCYNDKTCGSFNVIIDWFTNDGIYFNEIQANIFAEFHDRDGPDTLIVTSAQYYPQQDTPGLQLNVSLIIGTSQIPIPIVPPEQFPVKPIGHFVFIDAIFTVQNSSTPNLLLSLATSSAIAMYKYSSVYYNSDGLPFPEANPCATRSVDVFSDNQNIDEYANMTSKSHICCTSWLPIAQNSTTTSEQTTTETSNTKLTTTETPAKKQTQSYIWLIILCTVIALIALISITVLIIRYRKKKHQARIEDLEIAMQKLSNFPNYNTPEASKKDPYLIDENKLHVDFKKTIGKGCSATVYQAHLEGPSPLYLTHKSIQAQQFQDCNVAIKIAGSYGNNEDEMLLQEIETMKRLGYQEHIIAMLGWCMHKESPCAVFELAATGDLLSEVRRRKRNDQEKMSLKEILSILWQIATGMQYIAWKQMAHRDLAARNILLTDSYKAKIADFGLCCTFDDSLTYQASRQKKLPMKWLSIEAISKRQFSEKSDVWSFGVLMYEIFSGGKVPYTTMSNDEMLEFLQEGNRLSCPEETPEEVYEIMLQCWNQEPVNRPTFEEMVEKFRNMLNMVTGSDGYLS